MMRLPSLLEHFELAEKTARDAMTPISKAFSLYLDGTLNLVSENMPPLYDILYEFQKGHSHIAVVYRSLNESSLRRRMRPVTSTRASNIGAGPAPAIQDLDTNEEVQDSQEARTKNDTDHRQRQVLEKEEILDETNEYVNIHNRLLTTVPFTQYVEVQQFQYPQVLLLQWFFFCCIVIATKQHTKGNNIITSPEGGANELSQRSIPLSTKKTKWEFKLNNKEIKASVGSATSRADALEDLSFSYNGDRTKVISNSTATKLEMRLKAMANKEQTGGMS
ncbi:hypothetical protein RJ641_034243 [Dillenia turbinata]|uniref:Uncharacterized protein n=1 Tax=Dillenia turbinata TaxID=194707 RepID=A0AAN8VFJ8_9MAGN